MKFKSYIEAKQIGIIYHFTTFKGIKKLLNGNKDLNLDILEFISYNGVISTTRNFMMSDYILSTFPLSRYNIRIAIDGTRLSNKYKIKPIAGYNDNDGDIFNKNKNYKRVKRQSGEAEEAILAKKIKLKDYIVEIQIYNYDDERDTKYLEEIKLLIEKAKLKIPVNLVRKFKPFNEEYIDDKSFGIYL